jgi:hypothetical protein
MLPVFTSLHIFASSRREQESGMAGAMVKRMLVLYDVVRTMPAAFDTVDHAVLLDASASARLQRSANFIA